METLSPRQTIDKWKGELPDFLELPDEENKVIEVGTYQLQDSPLVAFEFLVEQIGREGDFPFITYGEYQALHDEREKAPKMLTKSEISALADKQHDLIPEDQIVWAEWRTEQESKYFRQRLKDYDKRQAESKEVKRLYKNNQYGYIKYLADKYKSIKYFLERENKMWLSKEDITPHSYMTGGTGSGKSYLLKLLTYFNVINDSQSSIIIIDPHGDLARDIARLKIFRNSNRLIYFDPSLAEEQGLFPVVNPLQRKEKYSMPQADLMAQSLIETFGMLIDNTEFTPQMETLLKPCLEVLLMKGNSRLRDILTFMNDDENEKLIRLAETSENETIRDLFKRFRDKGYVDSKRGISTKVQSLIGSYYVSKTINGNTTIDLESEIEQGKVIIFNLSKGRFGKKAGPNIGKFIVARIMNHALSRDKIPEEDRKPAYLYIDEVQNFLTDSIEEILTEARKYSLYLTMAQQELGQGRNMNKGLYSKMIGNSSLHIVGSNEELQYRKVNRDLGIDKEILQTLEDWKFYVKIKGKDQKLIVKTSDRLVKKHLFMNSDEWEKVEEKQIKRYYRPSGTGTPTKKQAKTADRESSYGPAGIVQEL